MLIFYGRIRETVSYGNQGIHAAPTAQGTLDIVRDRRLRTGRSPSVVRKGRDRRRTQAPALKNLGGVSAGPHPQEKYQDDPPKKGRNPVRAKG